MKPEKIKQNSRRYFDRVADKQHIIPEPNLCYDAVLEQLRSYDFMSLADISCGTGTMLSRICETYENDKTLYGVDLSPRSIDAAARKVGERVHLKEGDIDDIPLSEVSYFSWIFINNNGLFTIFIILIFCNDSFIG